MNSIEDICSTNELHLITAHEDILCEIETGVIRIDTVGVREILHSRGYCPDLVELYLAVVTGEIHFNAASVRSTAA